MQQFKLLLALPEQGLCNCWGICLSVRSGCHVPVLPGLLLCAQWAGDINHLSVSSSSGLAVWCCVCDLIRRNMTSIETRLQSLHRRWTALAQFMSWWTELYWMLTIPRTRRFWVNRRTTFDRRRQLSFLHWGLRTVANHIIDLYDTSVHSRIYLLVLMN